MLRESWASYNEYNLDACLEDGQPATTFVIEKSASDSWKFKSLPGQSYPSLQELLLDHHQTTFQIPGFELKECIPPSENGLLYWNWCIEWNADVES